MPDVFKIRAFTDTGDRVEIPDWQAPPPPEPEPVYGELPQLEPGLDPDPPEQGQQLAPEPEPEPEPEPPTPDELRELFHDDWMQLCQQEKKNAYADAKALYTKQFQQCLDEMDQYLSQMEQQQKQFFDSYAQELKYLAIDIAERWLDQRLQDDNLLLEKLVVENISSIKEAKWMDIELSAKMVNLAQKIREILTQSGQDKTRRVELKDAPAGTCVIQTDKGELDASIPTQAQVTRQVFRRAEGRLEGAEDEQQQ